ncbi:hypothetical protein FSP39_010147 [Pinctada imbricata]|uniref:Uncharacterized protein n=1 Tax=Pinctada imbricata TaxID=66713 RepID=A0AA88XZE8_PINIB|nr:hypothetical protein FSP39_010147 [Pinctada imbricata]
MSQQKIPNLPNLPDPEALFSSWWPIIIAVVCGFTYALRQYMRGSRCTSQIKLDGKVALVTGGGSGIGKFVAIDLAQRGCKVYITVRNEEQGQKALKSIEYRMKKGDVKYLVCELDKLKSVREFASAFKKKEEKLHYLIHSAGVMMPEYTNTEDNFELQFQVNYLASALLTSLLTCSLEAATPSRVIFLIAPAYNLGEINWEAAIDPNIAEKDYTPGKYYAQSKLAVVLFSLVLAEKLKEKGVIVHCANPGVTNTKIYRHMPFRKSAFISLSFSPFIWFFMKHPEDGAQTPLYCALSEFAGKETGKYYKECAIEKLSEKAEDAELQKKVWERTLEWLNIKEFGKTDD